MPRARPAEAGREVYSLPARRRVDPLLLLAGVVVIALDVLLLRHSWVAATAISALYTGTFVYVLRFRSRQPHLMCIGENGLVVESDGTTEWIDWRELASVVYFETFTGSQYDVNAKGVGYRLKQRAIGEQRLEDMIAFIVQRARFAWITETMAARPEILERYRQTLIDRDT